mgnify:CR=1 FL=1
MNSELRTQNSELVPVLHLVDSLAAGGAESVAVNIVNALPRESVRLFEFASAGGARDAEALYAWFLPLLRLDVVPKFVQLIKLVQQEVGRGSERVRPPRLSLVGEERDQTIELIRERVANRPRVS